MFGASSRHDKVFYDGFDRQAQHLLSASDSLNQALQAEASNEAARDEMRTLREQADESSRNLIVELRKTWITPFDPQEIRDLLASLDAVLSLVHGAMERVVAFHLPRREEAKAGRELAKILQECCAALARGLKLLREKKREDDIIGACEEVHRLNHRADQLYRDALARMYEGAAGAESGNQRILEVLKWNEVFDKLDEATTRCDGAARSIETVVSGRA